MLSPLRQTGLRSPVRAAVRLSLQPRPFRLPAAAPRRAAVLFSLLRRAVLFSLLRRAVLFSLLRRTTSRSYKTTEP